MAQSRIEQAERSEARARRERPGRVERAMIALIRGYQLVLSPILGPRCRHLPTCSEYAAEAISRHGVLRGGWLAVRRVVRCNPWGTSGYDPVP
ncbi:MAG: membrane protein insertion efficiency factor YidD [Gammaproteobacteria bacterium]|nr:membrane protein insertion efficiency factor YidD [Gammaproteobacteria bacterium]